AEPCIGTKDTACVDACPVDCIHPKKNTTYNDGRPGFDEVPQLYIDPVECIDCGACVPVCPVRSEEHTSELQSRGHLVCRLLLENHVEQRYLHSFPTRRSSDLPNPVSGQRTPLVSMPVP